MSGSAGKFTSPPPGFGPNMSPTPRGERPADAKFTSPPPGFGPRSTFPR